jgi:CelD/BcsL family acetyltransferase involved in cellulose biosynthesis
MSEFRIADNTSRGEWESFLEKSISGNLQQSFDYGEVMKMFDQHNRVIRLLASDGGSVVGVVQAIFHRRLGFSARLNAGGNYGFAPVVSLKDEEHILRELLSSLEKISIKNRVLEGFIFRPESDQVLESMGYAISAVVHSYRVGLQKCAEGLWKSIEHNKRRNIKKAQEQGAEVVQLKSYDALVSFYEMYEASSERVGFTSYSFNYFNSYLRLFGARDKVRVFLTVFNGQPVAGVFVVVYGDTAYALAAGSRKDVWQVRPNDLLHWKAMEWACGEGFSWYHMGHVYVPLPTENSPGWSLWRWKREWNGQLKKYYIYHKVYMPNFKKFVLTPYEKIGKSLHKIGF